MRTILVTGGAGYLGNIVVRKLLDKDDKVKVLDCLIFGDEGIRDLYDNPDFELINKDIRNIENYDEVLDDVDGVIHLAAIVGDPACSLDANYTNSINYLSTKKLASLCKERGIKKFVFASSCSVYGSSSGLLSENSSLNPLSLYAETRLNSEKFLLNLKDKNFKPIILRLATLCGRSKRMRFDLVVNLFSAKAINEKEICVFGGEQWRPNLHVEDAADAFVLCLDRSLDKLNSIFNVGSNDQNFKILEIGKFVKRLIPDIRLKIENKKIDKRDYNVNFDKINKLLDFNTKKTVVDAIKEIKESFENGEILNYKDKKYNNFETFKRLLKNV